MDELEKKSDEELEKIVLAGINLLPHVPQSESNRAKRILEYRKSKKMNHPTKKSERKIKLVDELVEYRNALEVKKLYEEPEHKNSKDWLAEVSAILKNLDETDYKKFSEFRQHLHDSIPFETRKHAAEQLDSFLREKVAEYKRYDFSYLDEDNIAAQDLTELRIFLSYSSKNKVGVGKIKLWLSDFGFKVFLAHEDIEPSLEWQKVIIKKLKACHVFIPVITPQFNESKWTDQESGMAVIENKLIIPISVDDGLTPHGFLAIYQSLPMKSNEIEKGCIKIIKAVKNDPRYVSMIFDMLLLTLEKSHTYASVEWKTSILAEFDSLSKEQLNSILKIAIDNNQIHYASGSRGDLINLIKKYKELVDPNLLEKLNNIDQDFKFG